MLSDSHSKPSVLFPTEEDAFMARPMPDYSRLGEHSEDETAAGCLCSPHTSPMHVIPEVPIGASASELRWDGEERILGDNDLREDWNFSKQSKKERMKMIRRIERNNKRISIRCNNLKSQILSIEKEQGWVKRNSHAALREFRDRLDTLTQHKQILLQECNMLAQKIAYISELNALAQSDSAF